VHSVHADYTQSEISFAPPSNDFTNACNVIYIRFKVRCEDRFDDLGASRSEICAFFDQIIEVISKRFCNSHAKFLSGRDWIPVKMLCTKCTAILTTYANFCALSSASDDLSG